MAAPFDRSAIEAFLVYEAALLDDRKFEEWRELFDENGYYWVPLRPDQQSPDDEASLFYDTREVMQTRFERLRHPRIHSQTPPHRTCHLVGNVAVVETDAAAGQCTVRSSLLMADYRLRVQRIFAGKVQHRLRPEGGSYRIVWKRVDLINCDDSFELIAAPI
jgi:3-phenylpropionate/cinnamic acid dioxygenase small subunit